MPHARLAAQVIVNDASKQMQEMLDGLQAAVGLVICTKSQSTAAAA
jgi:hypothetical protein